MTITLNSHFDEEFTIEAHELLDQAEDALLKLDNHNNPEQIYQSLFRAFHSLKGTAGMLGHKELHDHLHSLENGLQKSKGDHEKFKDCVDYFLKGIDVSRQYLNGETPLSPSKEMDEKKIIPINNEVENIPLKTIFYLSHSSIKPLGREILEVATNLHFLIRFLTPEELQISQRLQEHCDILITDINCEQLNSITSVEKIKCPIILIVKNDEEKICPQKIFQFLKKEDDKIRIQFTLMAASRIKKNLDIFDKAKNLLMFMYSDLEEHLLSKKSQENQKFLDLEIKNFLKKYSE